MNKWAECALVFFILGLLCASAIYPVIGNSSISLEQLRVRARYDFGCLQERLRWGDYFQGPCGDPDKDLPFLLHLYDPMTGDNQIVECALAACPVERMSSIVREAESERRRLGIRMFEPDGRYTGQYEKWSGQIKQQLCIAAQLSLSDKYRGCVVTDVVIDRRVPHAIFLLFWSAALLLLAGLICSVLSRRQLGGQRGTRKHPQAAQELGG
jgi:hypothetical protein